MPLEPSISQWMKNFMGRSRAACACGQAARGAVRLNASGPQPRRNCRRENPENDDIAASIETLYRVSGSPGNAARILSVDMRPEFVCSDAFSQQ
jgi:hypothetical protein